MIYAFIATLVIIGAQAGIIGGILYVWRRDVNEFRNAEKLRLAAESEVVALRLDNRELRQYLEQTKEALRNEVERAVFRDAEIAREGSPEAVTGALRSRLAEPMDFETRTPIGRESAEVSRTRPTDPMPFDTRTPPAGFVTPPLPAVPEVPFELPPNRNTDVVDTLRLRLREPLAGDSGSASNSNTPDVPAPPTSETDLPKPRP